MTERTPAETFHPAEFIADELAARNWTSADAAIRMPGDIAINMLALDLYLAIRNPNLRLGDLAEKLGVAFGVSPKFFANLERAYLSGQPEESAP